MKIKTVINDTQLGFDCHEKHMRAFQNMKPICEASDRRFAQDFMTFPVVIR